MIVGSLPCKKKKGKKATVEDAVTLTPRYESTIGLHNKPTKYYYSWTQGFYADLIFLYKEIAILYLLNSRLEAVGRFNS